MSADGLKENDGIFKDGVFISQSKEWWKEAGFESEEELAKTIKTVKLLLTQPKGTNVVQLMQWRKIGSKMLKVFKLQSATINASKEMVDRVSDKTCANHRKKWTDIEDEQLINAVCDETSIIEVACLFGRSPSAIKSRVSYLVGIKRITSDVAGRFVGTINGDKVEGNIKGQITKV